MSAPATPVYRDPIVADWATVDLEVLGLCPVCGCTKRFLAYENLRDRIFFCAPGHWTSWRCSACNVAYLDPRPTQESIGRAYGSYYTHVVGMDTKAKQSLLKKLKSSLRRIVRNSYLNEKYNYRLKPALPLLWLAIALQPARARQTGSYFRHLPGPKSKMDILLDIGCANGHFLQIARDELGYQVEGLEIDPHAREIAQSRGLKIHAGQMPGSGLSPGSYAQITLSHVLEHLHDPLAALQECRDLLHPGGRIWLCIPNLAATSLGRFGIYSFLLDPPRHLVMFDSRSLSSLLAKAGFQNIQLQSEPGHDFMFIQSWMVEQGMDPYATPFSVVPAAIKHELIAKYRSKPGVSEYSEIITMTATKPL